MSVSDAEGPGEQGIPFLHTINTEVNPPDAGNAKHTPEYSLLAEGADWKP